MFEHGPGFSSLAGQRERALKCLRGSQRHIDFDTSQSLTRSDGGEQAAADLLSPSFPFSFEMLMFEIFFPRLYS